MRDGFSSSASLKSLKPVLPAWRRWPKYSYHSGPHKSSKKPRVTWYCNRIVIFKKNDLKNKVIEMIGTYPIQKNKREHLRPFGSRSVVLPLCISRAFRRALVGRSTGCRTLSDESWESILQSKSTLYTLYVSQCDHKSYLKSKKRSSLTHSECLQKKCILSLPTSRVQPPNLLENSFIRLASATIPP